MKRILFILAILIMGGMSYGQCYILPILGNSNIKVADTTILSDAVAGGSWSCSNAAIASVNSSTGVVRGISKGTATITYALSGICSTYYATRQVQVRDSFSGRNHLCTAGDTATYRNRLTSANVWSSSNSAVVTINSATGLMTSGVAGYSVISAAFTVLGNTYTVTDTVRVKSVTAIGPITGGATFCSGASDTLRDTTTYVTWRSTDTTIARIARSDSNKAVMLYNVAGTAKVILTSVYCLQIKDSVTLLVNPLPSPGVIFGAGLVGGVANLCSGATISLSDTGATGISGVWSSNQPYFATVSSTGMVTTVPYISGNAVIRYMATTAVGCSAYTSAYIYIDNGPYVAPITGPTTMPVGTTATLTSMAYPWAFPVGFNSWFSSNSAAVPVNPAGIITGLSVGTVTITHYAGGACGVNSVATSITVTPPAIGAVSTGFTAFINRNCSTPQFGVSVPAHAVDYFLRTSYGDGYTDITLILAAAYGAFTTFTHSYATSGNYTIKQVLYNGTIPFDSVVYTYQHLLCRDISVAFYIDSNDNCVFDAAFEHRSYSPILVEIDSNGIVKDTISATGGIYYSTMGLSGDVFSFRIVGTTPALHFSCPLSGIVYDTITTSGVGTATKFVGLTCSSPVAFDLAQLTDLTAGRHAGFGSIYVDNRGCSPQNTVVTLNISPKYAFDPAHCSIPPYAVAGNTVTWYFPALANTSVSKFIYYELALPTSTWLTVGDTVHTTISITPDMGDIDPSNNIKIRIDTVKSSYDPNHISVSPAGNILNGTKLHYAIEFENDGNDTAHNIHVMDTLSDALNISTLRVEGSTAVMNISVVHSGGHNIIKFDFPNIKLLDSSHHGQCTGTVWYSINARTGLADGTDIVSHAGIYFDDNPVVMTDSAFNKIVVPYVSIATGSGDTICNGQGVHLNAISHSVSNTHYRWYINSVATGTDSTGLTIPAAMGGDTVKCIMISIMDDSIFSTSNSVVLINRGLPSAGVISGASSVCVGANIAVFESLSTGLWSIANSHATFAAGIVHGVSAGVDTVLYATTNVCGTSVAIHPVTINPLPVSGSISGASSVCPGASVTLSSSVSGGSWTLSNSHASHVGGAITGVSAGTDTVFYTVTNMCGSANTRHVITVNVSVIPDVSATVYPNDSVCGGDTVIFTSIPVNGGTTPFYLWRKFGTIIGTGTTLHYLPSLGDVITCDMISSVLCPSDDTVTSTSTTMMVVPMVTPSAVISTAIGDSISYEGQMVTINSTLSYCGAGTYQWYRNGVLLPGETSATLLIAVSGDDTFYCVNNCNTPCATSNIDTSNSLVIYGDYLSVGVYNIHSSISNLTLFPNPNNGSFTLTGNIPSIINEDVHFDVLDITGKLMYSGTTTPLNGVISQRLDMTDADVAPGHYMLRMITGSGVEMLQFVIMK